MPSNDLNKVFLLWCDRSTFARRFRAYPTLVARDLLILHARIPARACPERTYGTPCRPTFVDVLFVKERLLVTPRPSAFS